MLGCPHPKIARGRINADNRVTHEPTRCITDPQQTDNQHLYYAMESQILLELEVADGPSDSPPDTGPGMPPGVVQAHLRQDRRGHAQAAGPLQRTARVRHKNAAVKRPTCSGETHSDENVDLHVVEVGQHQFILPNEHTFMIVG